MSPPPQADPYARVGFARACAPPSHAPLRGSLVRRPTRFETALFRSEPHVHHDATHAAVRPEPLQCLLATQAECARVPVGRLRGSSAASSAERAVADSRTRGPW